MRITSLSVLALFAWVTAGSPSDYRARPPANESGHGQTYYVDSGANDANSGLSASNAWRSLAILNATTFHPGDRILLKSGGTWTGQLWPKGSGTAGHPITIDKYGGDSLPRIDGAGLTENTVLLKNQQYWEIRNLEITNHGETRALRRGVYILSENSGDLHHIYLQNLTVHDVNGDFKQKVNGGVHYNSVGDVKPSRFVDLRIEQNHIYHVDRSGIFGWSSHWTRSKWYPSLGVVIRNNVLDDIGGDGIVNVATDGALIEHNVVSRASQRSQDYNVGIWPWSADNTVIQYNEVYATKGQHDAEGFDSDWNSRNTLIQYNYSHDNEGGFLLICNEGSQSPNDSAGNTGTIVRYNISQNDHHRAIKLSGPVNNTLIYNNTIYVGKRESSDLILHSDWRGWASDTYIYNNIFYVEGKGQFGYGVKGNEDGSYDSAPGPGKSINNVYDSNVYFGVEPALGDPHGLTSNPMLAAPGSAGLGLSSTRAYTLLPGSPAIDSGRRIEQNGGKDFFGRAVPLCAGTDRGALEWADCVSNR